MSGARVSYGRGRRRRVMGIALVIGAITTVLAIHLDAARRRSDDGARHEGRRALVRMLGLADLALSSSARWLRHPSQAEPGAAFADAPASFDADPGSALLGPPTELFRATDSRAKRAP